MTTRVQALRSSTTGAVPAAGTRLPGELWTNFPDLQLGVVDASKNAQKLVAVRYFSTGANYAVGDFVIQAGVLYAAKSAITAGAFNATQWTQIAAATDASGPYLALTGGTLTGALLLAADPGASLGAATKQYVDGKVSAAPFLPIAGGTLTGKLTLSGPPSASLDAATKAYVDAGAFVPVTGGANTSLNDNRIINGDMRIDQRNNGANGTAVGYTVDRWQYSGAQPNKGTWGRVAAGASLLALGSGYSISFASTSAYAAAAGEVFAIHQPVEADMVGDFAWGTAGAQPVTLSFWANSTLTGTFSGSIRSYPVPAARSYPFTFSLPTANTWTKIAVTIPGDTAGTWVLQGNAAALAVVFDLGSGATLRGSANTWASANYVGATGSVSVVAVNGANFFLTGVKLEIGSVTTPFNRQSLTKSMADCQRYYQQYSSNLLIGGNTTASGFVYTTVVYPVVMRATPTFVFTSPSYSNASALVMSSADQGVALLAVTITASGYGYGRASPMTLSAEL